MPNSISLLSRKIDSLKTVADSLNESQQVLSSKIDTLCEMNSDMIMSQSGISHRIDTISTQLNNISEYGVGFSDSVSHISIPLIIALFAFAFPFLFTVISHINNKYKSERITKMLSAETSYKWFMGGAIVCASFLFLAGVLSICLKGGLYTAFNVYLDVTSVVIAGGYSAIIIWFVFTCVNYNSPWEVLERIGSQFECKAKTVFSNTIRAEKRIYREEYSRIYRYIDLCKYAVRQQNYQLFINVLLKVSGLKHKREKLESLNFEFYEEVLDTYLFGKPNAMMEDSLMMYWFMTFKKSEEPNLGLVFRMFKRIVSAVLQGRSSLFENYLLKSKYGYRYITDLSIVNYVRGCDLEEQKKVDDSKRRTWRDLCEMHNIAIAHLFSLGYNEVIRIVQLGDNTGYDRLIPGTGIEVLKMFARCKEKQLPDGQFNYWACEHVIGKNTDPMMLEKYAAIMLLLASNEHYDELKPISPQHLQSIKDAKNDIVKYAKLWKADAKLKGLFPQIEEVNAEELVDEYIKWFEGGDIHAVSTEGAEEKKCVIAKIIDALIQRGGKSQNKNKRVYNDIYTKDLLESEKNKIAGGYLNMINGNRGYVLDYLYGPESEDKTESEEMGSYTYLMFKKYLVEDSDIDYNLDLFGETRVYQSRYMYMLLKAMKSMKIEEDRVRVEELKRYLKEYLGDKGGDYVVIDIGSAPHLLLSLDKEDKTRRSFNDMRVLKATYKSIDFSTNWFLRDLDELEVYENTLLIIKKTDLPYDYSTSPDFGPTVTFEDVSDKEKGKAEVRVTVNPHLAIRYNKKAKVRRVKIERTWK